MTIPPVLMKEVFGNLHAASLLDALAEAKVPLRYSAARKSSGLRPQEFQRAIDTLESFALIQLRASRDGPKNAVYLEISLFGRILAEARATMEKEVLTLARRHRVSKQMSDALEAAG